MPSVGVALKYTRRWSTSSMSSGVGRDMACARRCTGKATSQRTQRHRYMQEPSRSWNGLTRWGKAGELGVEPSRADSTRASNCLENGRVSAGILSGAPEGRYLSSTFLM